jgi:hypothetical protein
MLKAGPTSTRGKGRTFHIQSLTKRYFFYGVEVFRLEGAVSVAETVLQDADSKTN